MLYLRNKIAAVVVIVLFIAAGCKTATKEKNVTKEEIFSERDEISKAMEQEFLMTKDPALGYIPKERMIAALNYEKRLIASRQFRTSAFSWQERGPNNVAGRTRAFFIDSRDATGNTVFAASVSGGIWKCTNFKTTPVWTPVNESMGSLAVCALAQDPSNPNIIYAGTGEGWFNNDAVRGNGIWKSTDGGSTWNQLSFTDSSQTAHNFDFIQDIVVNNNGVVFASGRPSLYCNVGGIFRSATGGVSWSRPIGNLPTNQPCDSAYNFYGADLELASSGDVYATTGFINSGQINRKGKIFRSSAAINGANVGTTGTWKDITPTGTWQRIEMAVAPSNSSTIYALLEGTGDGIGAIKKSIDSGATWTDLPLPTWCNQGTNSTDFTHGQAFYDLIVSVDPTNANTVIIGGIDLFKSTNGGTTWTQLTQWASNCTTLPVVHADQHNIQFMPGSSTQFIATNDGGIYYTSDGGTTWATYTAPNLNGANQTTYSSKNIGYNVTQLYACDIHPTQTNYFLAGSQDNGSQKFTLPGLNTTVEASVGGDGGFCHIDQTDGKIQILSYVYNYYYYSRDNGVSFSRISFNNNGLFINPSDYDDVKKVLYTSDAPGQMGVVSNLIGPGTPTFTSSAISGLGTRKISALKVDPTVAGGGTVWIAGYDSTGTLKPAIIKVTNATTTPVASVTTTLTDALGGTFVSSIDVDPANASHLLVTLSNYGIVSVYESTDDGNTFNNIEGNLPDIPVRWGMFLPANASVDGITGGGILLATEVGVWFTPQSAGKSTAWIPENTGLPNVRTDMLRYRASDNLLAVATHGRGLFTTNLTSIATGLPSVDNTKNFIDYVSAGRQQLFVKVGNLTVPSMQIRIFDANGRLVYSSSAKYANQSIPIGLLAGGSYIIKVYGNKNEQYTKQFVK